MILGTSLQDGARPIGEPFWFDLSDLPPLAEAKYVIVRPISTVGDHIFTVDFTAAAGFQLFVGFADQPPVLIALYEKFEDAFDTALSLKRSNPHLSIYYEGHDLRAKVKSWRDLSLKLAHRGQHDEWETFLSILHDKKIGALGSRALSEHFPKIIQTALERTLAEH